MNEEVLRIQKMVAEGKVSAEESVELLASLAPPASECGQKPRAVPGSILPWETEVRVWAGVGLAALIAAVAMLLLSVHVPAGRGQTLLLGASPLLGATSIMGLVFARRVRGAKLLLVVVILAIPVAIAWLMPPSGPSGTLPH